MHNKNEIVKKIIIIELGELVIIGDMGKKSKRRTGKKDKSKKKKKEAAVLEDEVISNANGKLFHLP